MKIKETEVLKTEEGIVAKTLSRYNSILKENDDLYRGVAKAFGMPDCTFWILYALREEKVLTQSEICSCMYQPKQTVNSALKKLETEGYIALTAKKDRRSKQIELTEKGEKLAAQTVDKIFAVEQSAMSALTKEEREAFLGLFRKYIHLLKEKMLSENWMERRKNGDSII